MTARLWFFLFLVLLAFPASYNIVKALFCLLVLLGYAYSLIRGERLQIRHDVAFLFLLSGTLGIFLVIYDYLRFDFADLRQANIYLIAPFIYFFFTLLFSKRAWFPAVLDKAIYWSSIFVSLNGLIYLFSGIVGYTHPLLFLDLDYYRGIDENGIAAYSTTNLPVLGFTIPYLMASYFLARNRTGFTLFALIISIIGALASLRVSIAIAIVMAVVGCVLLFLYMTFRQDRVRFYQVLRYTRNGFGVLLATLVVAIIVVRNTPSLYSLAEGLYEKKLESELSGDDPRYLQSVYWLEGFARNPILGNGISSSELVTRSIKKPGIIRNPYGYELTYYRLLSEIGLLSFLLYGFQILYLLYLLFQTGVNGKTILERSCLGHILGMVGFLFISGTNGYLLTFGVTWILFYPLTYQHTLLMNREQTGDSEVVPGTLPSSQVIAS